MTEYVLPTHANAIGTMFGGQTMAWMDLCGAICAQRHTGCITITAGIDELSFEKPVHVGQVVRLAAQVTAAFRTSVEVLVTVEGEDPRTAQHWFCVSAFITYVAVDDALNPTAVPALLPETDEERALAAAALARREHRLAGRRRHVLPTP